MEAFGRGLVAEPYVATVVLGAALVSECANERQKQAMLPKVADGSLLLAFAHSERHARFDLSQVNTVAAKTPDGWRLDGQKIAVLDGHAAHLIIVSARLTSGDGAAGKMCLFLVPPDAAGVTLRDFPRLGGGRACNIELTNVTLAADALLGDGYDVLSKIEATVDRALAALGAEAVGIMQTMLDRTLEYTKVRQQFGRPLSANQVIRHRLADMAMQCDEARSIALRAALMADAEQVARGRAASGAKAKIGKCARFVAEQAVQLHGAMGVTEELDIGSYFKRLLAFDTMFGGSAHHFRRHAALRRADTVNPELEAAMDLTFSAEERDFEKKSATSSPKTSPPEIKRAQALTPSVFSDPDIGIAWQKSLHRRGWGAPGWPVEHGGPDWTPAQRWIFEAECARAGAPNVNVMGVKMVGPVIIGFGSAGTEELLLAADSFRRRLLVPRLFRTRLRLRSRVAENASRARRRQLHRQRHQDLDHACSSRQPDVRAGAHQRHRRAGRTASASS